MSAWLLIKEKYPARVNPCRMAILGNRLWWGQLRKRSALFAHFGVALGVDFVIAFLLLGRQRFTDARSRAGAGLNEAGAFGEAARGKFLSGLFEYRFYLCDLLVVQIQIALQPLDHSVRPARAVWILVAKRAAFGQVYTIQRTARHRAERKDDRDQQPNL